MKLHIVAIDDSSVNLRLISYLIRQVEDCNVSEFMDPKQGLEYCIDHVPDLVIVDYMMPELDGIEFIERFRASPGREDIPVLMVTVNDETEIRYRALEAGANDFLTRPVDKIEFMARTRNMLSLRRSQRKLLDTASWLTDEVRIATEKILARERETIIRLSKAADSRDPDTGTHVQRMSEFCRLIAEHLGMPEERQQILMDAAPMHDVGKVGIPDQILLNPHPLDTNEIEVMRKHSQLGFGILNGSQSEILQAAAQIALSHHEKFDGTGYPYGLAGDEIPVFARICAVADVFDALISDRAYKKAWTDSEAIAYLQQGRGSHFDPACVDAFLGHWDEVMRIRHRFEAK